MINIIVEIIYVYIYTELRIFYFVVYLTVKKIKQLCIKEKKILTNK